MDGIREFLEAVRDNGLAAGHLRGLFHVAIGRRISRAVHHVGVVEDRSSPVRSSSTCPPSASTSPPKARLMSPWTAMSGLTSSVQLEGREPETVRDTGE